MAKKSYELSPRDVLFFRDARPMDVNKDRTDDVFNIGHGAYWPRPDQLFSAVIHELIRDPQASEKDWYGSVSDLRVTGPFPLMGGKLYLPMPQDWDMKLIAFDPTQGATDIPAPLTAGFADRVVEKKSYPRWIATDDYIRYLKGTVGEGKGPKDVDEPENLDGKLYVTEPRVGTTLDASTGASRRVAGKYESGQYEAEYLRLGKGVKMVCEVETEKVSELENCDVRFGGQGGMVRFESSGMSLEKIQDYIHTENAFVNTLINNKIEYARNENIVITSSIHKKIKEIDNYDLCTILGNIIDNAIEAELREEQDKREIEISSFWDDGDCVFRVGNYISQSVLEENKELKTTKTDKKNHGIGTQIIKSLTKKNQCSYDYYEEGSMFYCEIRW